MATFYELTEMAFTALNSVTQSAIVGCLVTKTSIPEEVGVAPCVPVSDSFLGLPLCAVIGSVQPVASFLRASLATSLRTSASYLKI